MIDIPFLSKKDQTEDQEDDRIEFAGKLGEDLTKKDSAPQPAPSQAAGVKQEPPKSDLPEEAEEKPADFLSKFFSSLKSKMQNKSSGVLEVNLVRGEIVKYFDWQKGILSMLVFVFLAMVILSLAYWGISWWGANRKYSQNQEYVQSYLKLNKSIKELEGEVDKVLLFKKKLDVTNYLLDRHIYWTNFFDFLEDNTLSNVYFSSFGGDVNGKYVLGATTDSFEAINAQINKFLSNTYIKSAEVSGGSVSGEKGRMIITFDFKFTIDPEIFYKK